MKLKKKVFKFCLHLNDAWNFSYEKKFSAFFYFLLREKLGYSLRQFIHKLGFYFFLKMWWLVKCDFLKAVKKSFSPSKLTILSGLLES